MQSLKFKNNIRAKHLQLTTGLDLLKLLGTHIFPNGVFNGDKSRGRIRTKNHPQKNNHNRRYQGFPVTAHLAT